MSVLFPLLLLTYPVVLHLGIYFGHIDLVIFYLAILLSLPFLFALLKRTRPGIWQTMAVGLAFMLLVLAAGNEQLIVKLIPLTVNGVLLWFFASTLVSGKTPLITRFASLMREDMPPAVMVYTRWATIAWSGYFLVMFILSLILAITAPIELWSFFSNVLSYVLLVLMFLAEFTVRRLVVHEHMDYSFTEFLQRLKNVNFRSVLK
ncbi:MAG: hypothetical protein U9N50_05370 [Pseudomonadota bacterium]|nr:hypothetical protein [Pseudomonadota bacterium]